MMIIIIEPHMPYNLLLGYVAKPNGRLDCCRGTFMHAAQLATA